jgi:hypothetical protein
MIRGDMNKKTLCLTPECSKLWAVRPGLGYLYNSIIMDNKDYEDILALRDEGTFKFLVARNIERYRMEGILIIKNYSKILTPNLRKKIHHTSNNYVSTLSEKEQIKLSISCHKDYLDYIRSQILFCSKNEPRFGILTQRLNSVMNRLKTIQSKPEMNDELSETLKRIVSKSLAGTFVVSKFDGAHLYDTYEYRPFIKSMSMKNLLYDDEHSLETRAIDMLAAIILKKKLPDITVYDEYTMTQFLMNRNEIALLQDILDEIINRYHDLVEADPEVAKEHLYNSFNNAVSRVNSSLRKIKTNVDILWKTLEVLGVIKLPIIGPLLEPLKEKNVKVRRSQLIESLKSEDRLMGNIIFVFDRIYNEEKKLNINIDRTWLSPKKSDIKIWGEDKDALPWYEQE